MASNRFHNRRDLRTEEPIERHRLVERPTENQSANLINSDADHEPFALADSAANGAKRRLPTKLHTV